MYSGDGVKEDNLFTDLMFFLTKLISPSLSIGLGFLFLPLLFLVAPLIFGGNFGFDF